ncbi:39S ribosomal protein L20, mitochondrial [Apis mellifera caucasica]|uniref:Large ribosomal subunit protein bL20m n=1 Tax=Apis mellifera TaxID=7460 RepID=A0A7M7R5W8_APIME|nr:39S ribosomal protein L20, mitochondrial [Apis mellifera]KAG6796170.1 39S ribosomal protein L20, mitochondrial [Apis mellifera caucasica]KAG9427895.1 39S ribosomal protein L20, mitochondrial [Apis mellifera carnica]|eukprot:XP_393443.1 39S ribosomal protein L20, mitochondrial [Apis mellifera]
MVFLSAQLFVRCRGPDEFWRKRQIFKLAAHYIGRRRNCYSLTIKSVHRALQFSTKGRKLKKQDMRELWETRIDAATNEHGIGLKVLLEGLSRCNILLNRKSLAILAIWEPRTFKCLSDIACAKAKLGGDPKVANNSMPENVMIKGLVDELD